MRLHRKYGYGLKGVRAGLRGATDAVNADSDPMANGEVIYNKDGTATYNGVTFDPTDVRTFVLGAVAGLQYNNNTYGKCFYAAVDTVNFLDYFEKDFKRLFTEYNFYSLMVYDPTHFYGNIVAAYE